MKPLSQIGSSWQRLVKKILKISLSWLFIVFIFLAFPNSSANADNLLISVLAQGDAITDPEAILRYALPIDNPTIRQLQKAIEEIPTEVRRKRWPSVQKAAKDAAFILSVKSDKLLIGIPENKTEIAQNILETLKTQVKTLQEAVENKDRAAINTLQAEIVAEISQFEEMMVQSFPFEVPAEYSDLPQLKGRATVEMDTTQGKLTLVVDGYSAPVTAGNFVDLVQRGFYDGLPFIRSEDNFVLQTGDPIGEDQGFIDPKTGKYRAIPLEILVKGNEKPIYGETLEDLGLYLPELALPFNSYGAVALARPSTDPNGGSSQFFFFKFDRELTPPGFNLMDGRYAVFGYMVDGQAVLDKLTDKDKIVSAKVTKGLENLENGA